MRGLALGGGLAHTDMGLMRKRGLCEGRVVMIAVCKPSYNDLAPSCSRDLKAAVILNDFS